MRSGVYPTAILEQLAKTKVSAFSKAETSLSTHSLLTANPLALLSFIHCFFSQHQTKHDTKLDVVWTSVLFFFFFFFLLVSVYLTTVSNAIRIQSVSQLSHTLRSGRSGDRIPVAA